MAANPQSGVGQGQLGCFLEGFPTHKNRRASQDALPKRLYDAFIRAACEPKIVCIDD